MSGELCDPVLRYRQQPADRLPSRSAAIETQLSQEPGALIAHGADGVEMAIPLEVLGVEAGAKLRLLLKESADPFAKERYSEGTHVVR